MSEISKFSELRKIDVSGIVEKKMGLSYLSWAWAVDTLLLNDPAATWEYKEPVRWNDTVMVFCTVKAFGVERTAQLPVMDHRNKAVSNPDAFQVNTAMQRCLAKAIALHGIGLYIYAGEDVPDEPSPDLTEIAQDWVNGINACKTIDQLKDAYSKAYAALAKDKNAVQLIANAKDLKKVELS